MARIGDYIQPGLNSYDPTPYLQAQGNATRTIGAGISNAIGDFGDVLKEQREKKNEVKANSKLIESYMTLFPDSAKSLEGIKNALADEDTPVSERHAIAKTTGDLISSYLDKQRSDAMLGMQQQQIDLEGRRVGIAEGQASRENEVFDRNIQLGDQARASEVEAKGVIAPALLEQYIRQAKQQEASGAAPVIPSAKLQEILQSGSTEAKLSIASALAAMQPEPEKVEFRDIPITIGGQPGTVTARFNPQSNTFDVVPVRESGSGGSLQGLPSGLAPYAADFEEAGAQFGVDPKVLAAISMHETANGTSSAFKNKRNAMGISDSSGPVEQASVRDSIFHMAKRLGSTDSGPYKNAGTVGEVAGIYAPVGAENDPGSLNQHWTAGVSGNLKKLGGDPSAPIRITPGAVKGGTTKTPTEQALDEAKLAQIQQETGTQKQTADLAKSKDSDMKAGAIQSATDAIKQIDSLKDDPGFGEAVGASFYGTMAAIPGIPDGLDTPAGSDKAGAVAKIDQLKGHAFLNAIQQMRGLGQLSDAEGQRIQAAAARLDRKQGEAAFNIALKEYRASINAVIQRLGGTPIPEGASATQTREEKAAELAARAAALKKK